MFFVFCRSCYGAKTSKINNIIVPIPSAEISDDEEGSSGESVSECLYDDIKSDTKEEILLSSGKRFISSGNC